MIRWKVRRLHLRIGTKHQRLLLAVARNSQRTGDILNRIAVGYFNMLAAAVIRFVLSPEILPTMKNRRIFRWQTMRILNYQWLWISIKEQIIHWTLDKIILTLEKIENFQNFKMGIL